MQVATGALPPPPPQARPAARGRVHPGQAREEGRPVSPHRAGDDVRRPPQGRRRAAPEQLDPQVRIWAAKVRELSYNMEDAVDAYMVRVYGGGQSQEVPGPNKMKKRVKRFLQRTNKLFSKGKTLHQISDSIQDAQELAEELGELRQRYGIEVCADGVDKTIDPRPKAVYRDVTELVGIEDMRDELIEKLLDRDGMSKQQLKMLSIAGFGGSGKTTLALDDARRKVLVPSFTLPPPSLLGRCSHRIRGLPHFLLVFICIFEGKVQLTRQKLYGTNKHAKKAPRSFWMFVWDALHRLPLIILAVCALVSLVVGLATEGWPKEARIGLAIILNISLVVLVTASSDYKHSRKFMDIGLAMEPRELSHKFIKQITNDFDEELIVGSGGFGTVYKGICENGEEIAVKVLKNMPVFDSREFQKEFENLRRLKHRNVVELVGFCNESEKVVAEYNGKQVIAEEIHMALCFKYVRNGSLAKYMYDDECLGFNWHIQYKIIKGICEGLQYLRHGLEFSVWHLDLKPDNILLDNNMIPKITDFGLSRLLGDENTRKTISSVGTRGYMPPEYIEHGIISKEFDIFSLGVIIAKLMAGREDYFKIDGMPNERFVKHVHDNWRKRPCIQTLEPRLLEVYCKQVKICIRIALKCMKRNRHERPTIKSVVSNLIKSEIEIATLQGQHEKSPIAPSGKGSGATLLLPHARSRRRGATGSRRWSRVDGRTQDGGAVWRRGGVDGRQAWQGQCVDPS